MSLVVYARSRQKSSQVWKLFDNNNRCTDNNKQNIRNVFCIFGRESGGIFLILID